MAREEIASLKTIGEVAEKLDLPQHVLRFWETRFKEVDPVKRAGGRRFYRPRDIELVQAIRHLLYREGYTIKGVQRILKEKGVDAVIADVSQRQSASPVPPVAQSPRREPLFLEQTTLDLPPPVEIERPSASSDRTEAQAFHAPMVILQPAESDAALVLRRLMTEIEECRRLLELTRR